MSAAAVIAGTESESECFCREMGVFHKNECLSKLILFGEASLRRATTEFACHYLSIP
jgi:hypothetical protein